MQTSRVLPADIYDTLELSAEAYGGIGRGEYFETLLSSADPAPVCIVGHAVISGIERRVGDAQRVLLDAYGIDILANDRAVERINRRRRLGEFERVPFPDWCAELGVERGA